MTGKHVFISHSTHDDDVVAEIRRALEGQGLATWTDSRQLAAGDPLDPAIRRAIAEAHHVIAVLSPKAVSSAWVAKEIAYALEIRKNRGAGFKVIPLLIDPIGSGVLPLLFGEEPVGLKLDIGPGGISEALPDLLAALGKQLPEDRQTAAHPAPTPVADLVLRLTDPTIEEAAGKRRAVAVATLTYQPPTGSGKRPVESRPFRFTAPLRPIETGELVWYLEHYCVWPSRVFQQRARKVEAELPEWGRRLYAAAVSAAAREAFETWCRTPKELTRCFSVLVCEEVVEGSSEEHIALARESATLLLSLPWELVHDGRGYLFEGARGVRVRRQLPNRVATEPLVTEAPIRILLVSPRPEDDHTAYLDHRVSARPLVEALTPLGDLTDLTLLTPPTLPALTEELQRAFDDGRPYHVVHFDGRGVYDRRHGLGALCFEEPADAVKFDRRRTAIVQADELVAVIREHRVPLVFLEARQSAMADLDPSASVAGRLLQGGVASVVAMSHGVLVETARRFVTVFYRELMAGRPISAAMLAGRRELKGDTYRGRMFTGEVRLADWFVPVLFQEDHDPQLISALPAQRVREVQAKARELVLGDLPAEPGHKFVGRSRELLVAERMLVREWYVVINGVVGAGKTTMAADLARWLVASGRYQRTVFVSLANVPDARALLNAIGVQLVPDFVIQDQDHAMQFAERALRDQPTVIVLDNMESVLPPALSAPGARFEPEELKQILAVCRTLGRIEQSRLVFTSREALPEPFNHNHVTIGRLYRQDAIALVGNVLGEDGRMLLAADDGESAEEIEKLVDAVHCHAGCLVLLAHEMAKSGVWRATEHLHELMEALQERHPDDPERSLLASVELPLRRLPEGMREKIRRLGVFQGCGHLDVIDCVLGLGGSSEDVAKHLVDVGLAELLPYGHLRWHPALGPALYSELSIEERQEARSVWAEAMAAFSGILYEQWFKVPQPAAIITLLELPNLLAGLEHFRKNADAECIVNVAGSIAGLLRYLGRPKDLAWVARIQEAASRELGEWGRTRFNAESAAVDRLVAAGRHAEAVNLAEKVLQRCITAGERAYEGAAYDLALGYLGLGRALKEAGSAQDALEPLRKAKERFQKLADNGNANSERMAGTTLSETADCLRDLGRMAEAADAYESSIKLSDELGDRRGSAGSTGQLGTVRMLQHRYDDALAHFAEARKTFEDLQDPKSVAAVWHQTAVVYREAQQDELAEDAYRQSLTIKEILGDGSGKASTLNELGLLYGAMGRSEEAARFHRQAVDIFAELNDSAYEGRARKNLARQLIQLKRFDGARQQIIRAIDCERSFGQAAEPWKSYDTLYNLERAVGNDDAAAEARQRAIVEFLDYRRAGGDNLTQGWVLAFGVAQAIAKDQIDEFAQDLAECLRSSDLAENLRSLIPALQAVLSGSRDLALASDPDLHYADAGELILLIEKLG